MGKMNNKQFSKIQSQLSSREAAFTYAIASAGIVYSITAECARGNISTCGCDQTHKYANMYQNEAWKWGGCSVDILFGMKFARKFLDVREIEKDNRSLMNLHNNRAGRRIVKQLLRRECKCHGVSGSCAIKTCWKVLPSFRQVGDFIHKKYNKARLVVAETEKNVLTLVLKKKAKTVNPPKKVSKPKTKELVFLQQSPSYCEKDLQLGSHGTAGRFCNRTTNGHEGCDLLCCGRGYNTHQFNRTWKCRCKFHWCCEVKCDLCSEPIEEYTCK